VYKHLLISSLLPLLFTACSSDVKPYKLSLTNERAANSYRSANLRDEMGKVNYILSAIYLNDVYSEYPHDRSNLLISIYAPEQSTTFFLSSPPYQAPETYALKFGGKSAISVRELESDDPLIELMSIHTGWSKYYYVSFPLVQGAPILRLEGSDIEPLTLNLKKEVSRQMFGQVGSTGNQ